MQKGVSLIELLCGLALMVVLSGLVFPSMSAIRERNAATTSINWLITAVNFTRHAAITHHITMTLCPTGSGEKCEGKWHDGLMVFADHNKDAKLNGKDFIVRRINADVVTGTLKWRSFRNRQFLQMTPLGYTNFQNGNFVYCAANKNLEYARQIVISIPGRARVAHYRDDDGRRVDRKGKALRCE